MYMNVDVLINVHVVHHKVSPGYPHLYTRLERGAVGVNCLGQEHNAMSLANAWTWTAQSRVKCNNHEATVPPHRGTYFAWVLSTKRIQFKSVFQSNGKLKWLSLAILGPVRCWTVEPNVLLFWLLKDSKIDLLDGASAVKKKLNKVSSESCENMS